MNEKRERRWESVIQDRAAHFLREHSDTSSLITVTRVELVDRGKKARVLLSVLPEARESQAISFARRHERDIRSELQRSYSGFIPFISCELDTGEKNRIRIDEISEGRYDS